LFEKLIPDKIDVRFATTNIDQLFNQSAVIALGNGIQINGLSVIDLISSLLTNFNTISG
jgi:hypothetical protein